MKTIANCLKTKGHDVFVLASETSYAGASKETAAESDGIFYYPAYQMTQKDVASRLRNNLSEMNGSARVAKALGRFDVVVCTSPPLFLAQSGMTIAKNAGARFILDVRDIWPDVAYEMGSFTPGSIYGRVFNRISTKAYHRADLITTVSPGKVKLLQQKLSADSLGTVDKVKLIPNGLDLEFLNQEEASDIISAYHLIEDPPCVYVGNIGLAQGLSTLLLIAEKRPDKRFLLFGKGAEEAAICSQIANKGISNVSVCGCVDSQGVYTLLKHALCAYVPLKNSKMTNSVPTKLFEALGCGCPVLLAAQGDAADILEKSGLGFTVPPEDAEGLLRAFDAIVETDWSESNRESAIKYVCEEHSRQKAAERFEEALVTCVGGSDGAR